MILEITREERDMLVVACKLLAEDYSTISESAISDYLRRGFRADADNVRTLGARVVDLNDSVTDAELIAKIHRFMEVGEKINAIRYVRANRSMGLKEAKEYVERMG